MPHHWTMEEHIAVLALTKKYGAAGWDNDPLAVTLVSGHGIKEGSLGMAVRNFLALMRVPGGLENWSKGQEQAFREFGARSADELRTVAKKRLDLAGTEGA